MDSGARIEDGWTTAADEIVANTASRLHVLLLTLYALPRGSCIGCVFSVAFFGLDSVGGLHQGSLGDIRSTGSM